MLNALTVDVEDYFHVSNFDPVVSEVLARGGYVG